MNDECNSKVLLAVDGITKIFGELKANDDVSLLVDKGEIHALLGENGAGKSTLVKMLFGSLQPTAGRIIWKGEEVLIPNPNRARALGIGMVFQHFSLFEALSVAENIMLSLGETGSMAELSKRAGEVSQQYGLPLDPASIVGDLSVGERQRVEIIRCLLQDPDLIVLDEPTSVLTPQEADRLFETLMRLKDEGRSILYISHRLEEVQRICDRATILRHGKVVGECKPAKETTASLASKMVGAEIAIVSRERAQDTPGDELLEIEGLSLPAPTPFAIALEEIDLTVRGGEVISIAGVAGNGQGELFAAISGESSAPDIHMVRIRGQSCGQRSITARRRLGAAFVPEERMGHGAVGDLSLSENVLLARHGSDSTAFLAGGPLRVVRKGRVKNATARIVEAMDVRKSGDDPDASSLSGGNLQKLIMGRELDREPMVLVVNQPSWGVDAGAAARIRQALVDLARSGSAVLVISQDLDEIFEISDRVCVICDGRLSAPEPSESFSRERIGLLMAGMGMEKPADGGGARAN